MRKPTFFLSAHRRKLSKLVSLAISLGLLGGAAALLIPAGQRDAVASPKDSGPRVVHIALATAHQGSAQNRFFGTVVATERATLSFTVNGRMATRPVEVGQRVRRGALIAQLDPAPFSHAAARAEAALEERLAQYEQSVRDRERTAELWVAGALPRAEMESATAAQDVLSAAVGASRVGLSESQRVASESVLRAPFDGQVIDVFLEPGEFAMPGTPVALVSGDGPLELSAEVPESVVLGLREGVEVGVDLPVAGAHLVGRVTAIGSAIAGRGRLFPLRVMLEDHPSARPGMTAEFVVPTPSEQQVSVPVAAIRDPSGSHPSVFRVVEGRAVLTTVTLGTLDSDRVVVHGDLGIGDAVVTAGHAFLLSGDEVEVTK